MGYNKNNYLRIRKEYETKYLLARENADRRRAEVQSKIPDIVIIDQALSKTGLSIMSAAMQGDNVQEKIAEARKINEQLISAKRNLLIKYGYPEDYTDIKYECPICQDEGFYEFKICSCMKKKLVEAAYESSGMAHLLRSQSFENFDLSFYSGDERSKNIMSRVLGIAKAYAENFNPQDPTNMLFMGHTGLGKTHLSTAIARVVIDKGYDVFYASTITLISDYEVGRFGRSTGNESGLGTDIYTDCDLLIIDDLGTEVINQFTNTVIYNIVNTRISKEKSTIINTNLFQDDIRKRYSDRIASRLLGEYTIVPFLGKDVRVEKLRTKI